MKAFLVGFIFLLAVVVMAGIGLLLFPLLLVSAFFIRLILSFIFVLLAIWLLGKFIIWAWGKLT